MGMCVFYVFFIVGISVFGLDGVSMMFVICWFIVFLIMFILLVMVDLVVGLWKVIV